MSGHVSALSRENPSRSAPKRTLFICSGLIVGGAQRQWSLLIPALPPEFEVSVLTLVNQGPFFEFLAGLGVPTECVEMRNRFDIARLRRALGLTTFRPDLVVSQSIDAHVVGHAIARKVGAVHLANEHFNVGPGAPSRLHRNLLNRFIGPRLDGTIAVSKSQVPKLLEFHHRPERIRIIRNGVPTPTPTLPPSSVRQALGIEADAFVAVLVATLRPEKRAEAFVAAVQRAHGVSPPIRGLVVGGGSELERVRHIAGEDGVVQVLGERLDVHDLMNAADVVCLSSAAEGVPMALLEGMALAKPIVATAVGGVPEAVETERNGLLVDVDDADGFAEALIRLEADRDMAYRFGEEGRARHDSLFGVERMVSEYAAAFDEFVRG
jgi:L-malate glycosyltransferase